MPSPLEGSKPFKAVVSRLSDNAQQSTAKISELLLVLLHEEKEHPLKILGTSYIVMLTNVVAASAAVKCVRVCPWFLPSGSYNTALHPSTLLLYSLDK